MHIDKSEKLHPSHNIFVQKLNTKYEGLTKESVKHFMHAYLNGNTVCKNHQMYAQVRAIPVNRYFTKFDTN